MTGRHRHFTEEFQQEAVRLALSSGQPQRTIASDLGIARSTLSRWIQEISLYDYPQAGR